MHWAIDRLRGSEVLERKHDELRRKLEIRQASVEPDLDASIDDDIGDDLLRLILTACHPVRSTAARIALTVRVVGALTTGPRAMSSGACRGLIDYRSRAARPQHADRAADVIH